MFEEYLSDTYIINFKCDEIKELIKEKKWRMMEGALCIESIYSFVRDEVKYSIPYKPNSKASDILKTMKGDSYTKALLLMALLRGSGIPARVHLYKVYKHLMFGILDKKHLKKLPDELNNFVVEAYLDGHWIGLEGVILDSKYILGIETILHNRTGAYIGYGLGVSDINNIDMSFNGETTYIRNKAISRDVGIYASPDEIVGKIACEFSLIDTFFINKKLAFIRKGRA